MKTAFVEKVRGYLGTPFHHQGRVPGVGLDCAGVVVCALQDLGYPITDIKGYGRVPAQNLFLKSILSHFDSILLADIAPGDLMFFVFVSEPQHIAVVSRIDPILLIHSYSQVKKVVENSLDNTWMKRLYGCYRLRNI